MKICSTCKEPKDLFEFYRCASRPSGVQSQCKKCAKIRQAAWRSENPYKRKRASRIRGRNNRAAANLWRKEYREGNKDIYYAQKAVEYAIRTGKLKKRKCEVCGESQVHAHHESYARENRLVVMWLCPAHHAARHSASNVTHPKTA